MMGLPQNTFVELSISSRGIFFVFLEKVFPVMVLFRCLWWSQRDYFHRYSKSKYLPWLFHVLKISVITIYDSTKEENYFTSSYQQILYNRYTWHIVPGVNEWLDLGGLQPVNIILYLPPCATSPPLSIAPRQMSTLIPSKKEGIQNMKILTDDWQQSIHL